MTMLFKNAVILTKEPLDERTVSKGMNNLKALMHNALNKIMNESVQPVPTEQMVQRIVDK